MKQKKRLDARVQELHPHLSKTQIQIYIMQGKVTIEGVVCTKAGTSVADSDAVVLTYEPPRYVSRAGVKLEHALAAFDVDPTGLVVLDAGLSTGGFTDCLLKHGAKKVYGVDVGYGQVHEKIRTDPRVEVMERTNLRYLTQLPEPVDLATLDLSFISLAKVVPAVAALVKQGGQIIALIKPQFEAGRRDVGKGGIVKDLAVHDRVLEQVTHAFNEQGCVSNNIIPSPITGTEGNKEFLGLFTCGSK